MARTTSAAVIAILGDNYNSVEAPSLSGFIDTASSIIDDVVDCATDKGLTLSAAKLEILERWVAAHLYHCSDPVYQSKSTGGASGQFQGQSGMGLDGSRYGQMAIRADPSRCLAAIDKGGTVEVTWLGKPVSDQIDYEDRD